MRPQGSPRRRIEGFERPDAIVIAVDGMPLSAVPGESVAAALIAAGRPWTKRSVRDHALRGPFCMMGVCQECVVLVDGRRTPACQEPVRPGMQVVTGVADAG